MVGDKAGELKEASAEDLLSASSLAPTRHQGAVVG